MHRAVISMSGGQDSTTCLYWALKEYQGSVIAVFCNYGQRHFQAEAEAFFKVTRMAGVQQHVLPIAPSFMGHGALTEDWSLKGQHPKFPKLPATFIPLRNLVMFSLVASFGVRHDCDTLVVGVNSIDYSGYPDCRPSFLNPLQNTINQALYGTNDGGFRIFAPLTMLDKERIVYVAQTLPGCMEALAYSHTCYEGKYPPCGLCAACKIRAEGFAKAGIEDPLILRAKKEGRL